MKSLIPFIVMIAGLTVFFYVIDREEFNRYNDVRNAQTEDTESNKPLASISTEHNVEVQPVTESKPVAEIKPVIEILSVTEAETVKETHSSKQVTGGG